jgi:hypothetical protein
LRDKFPYEARSINVFRENGISSPDFARWLARDPINNRS